MCKSTVYQIGAARFGGDAQVVDWIGGALNTQHMCHERAISLLAGERIHLPLQTIRCNVELRRLRRRHSV